MEKYKICPTCGKKYPPNQVECFPCETDLTGLPIMADTQEEENPGEKKFVRVCECGQKNPPQARRCAACGEDISDIPAVEDARPDPREALAAKSDAEAVRLAVSRLSPVIRETVVMRYFGDMSVSEMAEALAVPEGTVKFRLSEGRRRIREFLSQRKIEITR